MTSYPTTLPPPTNPLWIPPLIPSSYLTPCDVNPFLFPLGCHATLKPAPEYAVPLRFQDERGRVTWGCAVVRSVRRPEDATTLRAALKAKGARLTVAKAVLRWVRRWRCGEIEPVPGYSNNNNWMDSMKKVRVTRAALRRGR